jgi:hypothetical protein
MRRVKANGRVYRVTILSVGQHFAVAAKVRVGGVDYRSRDVPWGCEGNAVLSLVTHLARVYPDAAVA